MRHLLPAVAAAALLFSPGPVRAEEPIEACKAFFAKFEKCVEALGEDRREEARIYMKSLRATLGMADDLNRGDPNLTGMLCGFAMDQIKEDKDVKSYNCKW
jgi:hypothetical protein